MKQNVAPFTCPQRLKKLLIIVVLMMHWIMIILNIQNILGKGLAWITDLLLDYTINILKYKLLGGSSYIKLPKEWSLPKKTWLIFKVLIIMNALNYGWSYVYIFQIIIQQEQEKLTKVFQENLI